MNGIPRQRLSVARTLGAAAILAVCVAFAALPARAATTLATGFSQAGGYGRIVLTWPGGVPAHKVAVATGVLVVTFDKPFAVDLNEFMRQMPDYVAMARQDNDGKTLRLALKFDYWTNVRQVENSLYVDLLPKSWAGAPPPLPADVLARIAAAKEARRKADEEARLNKQRGVVEPGAPSPGLSVRVARHDGMTRLVFDWNQPVLYSLAQQEGSATVTFDRTAKVALAAIRVNPPPYLQSITAQERDGRLSVFLKLAPGVTVSDFREDLGIVLDLKPAPPPQHGSEGQTLSEPATKPVEPAESRGPKSILPSAAADAPAATPAQASPDALPPAPSPAPSPAPKPEAAAPAVPARDEPAHDAAVATAQAEPHQALEVMVRDQHDRTEIDFPWDSPTGAAVFMRASTLWIVFDKTMALDLSRFKTASPSRLGAPAEIPVDGGVAIAVPILDEHPLVGVRQFETKWQVTVGETLASIGRPIAVTRDWLDTGQGIVSFALKGARKVLRVPDPTARDTLDVATAFGPVQAMQTPRSFIEFQALATAQGLAIMRVADDLNVATASDAVVVSRKNGLTLSADANAERTDADGAGSPAAMDFSTWRGSGNFIEDRKARERRVALADIRSVAGARMDYARFLVANGLGIEALTQIEMARDVDQKLEENPSFHALRGVANVMAHRNPEAIADLSINALAMEPAAAAWRALARAGLGQTEAARKDFRLAGPFMDGMGSEYATLMRLTAARVDLAMNDITGMQIHLKHLPAHIVNRELKAERLYLQAKAIESLQRPVEAAEAYDRVIETNVRPFVVRARFARALMLNKSGKLSDAKLASELDELRMMWRGDDAELEILTKLAELRLKQDDILSALRVMHVATLNFPHDDGAHALGARMPDIFASFFIDGYADKIPAVQALAVYHDFQDLTPIGRRGDELIRHLAERLVSVDLLPQAAELLSYQIEKRLVGGVAKAQVAARLATVYLLDEKPESALKAIRSTNQNQLPEDLDLQRRLIEARALASIKKYDLALDLLSEMPGAAASTLRADVFWEAQRWEEAGQAAEALLANAGGERALGADERFQIMRGAIAYSLGNDEAGLERMRTKFGSRMADTADASAFAVVTEPIERQGIAFRELASRIASVNAMERFVNSLKKPDRISAIDGTPVASN